MVLEPVLGAQRMAGGAEMNAIGPVLQNRHTRSHHVVEQAGEQRLELLRAARHQKVYVATLRNRGAVHRFGRQIDHVDFFAEQVVPQLG